MSLNCIKHGPVPVDDHAPLWRYVRLPQLLLLLNGELVLPSIRTLQRHDPKEGDRPWDEVVQMLAFDSEPELYDRLEEEIPLGGPGFPRQPSCFIALRTRLSDGFTPTASATIRVICRTIERLLKHPASLRISN